MILVVHFISCIVDTILFMVLLKYIANTMISFSQKTTLLICGLAFIGAGLDTLTNGNIGIMLVILLFPLCLHMVHGVGGVIKRIRQYFFVLLLYMSLEIFSIFIELILLGSLFGESSTNLRFLFITIVVNSLAVLGLWKLCGRRNLRIRFSMRDKILLLLVNVITFLTLSALVQFSQQVLTQNIIEQLLIIILNYSVIFFYIFFVLFLVTGKMASHFKEIGQITQNHMVEQLKYFSEYKETQEETRRFRHDMKNHLLYLQALSNENKMEEIQSYIQGLTEKWEELPMLYATGNVAIDTIINAKQFLFQNNQIDFSLSGNFTNKLKISPLDLCIIFANAIDNAIDANIYLDDTARYLKFDIKMSHNYYLVTLENPVSTIVVIRNNHVTSLKKDTDNHGFGLLNMEQTLKKYGGYMNIKSTSNKFILEIVFPR